MPKRPARQDDGGGHDGQAESRRRTRPSALTDALPILAERLLNRRAAGLLARGRAADIAELGNARKRDALEMSVLNELDRLGLTPVAHKPASLHHEEKTDMYWSAPSHAKRSRIFNSRTRLCHEF